MPPRPESRAYEQLKAALIHFEMGFEIMPGTGEADLSPDMKPFEQEPIPAQGECG